MEEETLTPEQINNWRKIIAIQVYQKAKSLGIPAENAREVSMYAAVMSEEEVIAYWRKTKAILENAVVEPKEEVKPRRVIERKPCRHTNSIKGSKGRYCLDCEMYV